MPINIALDYCNGSIRLDEYIPKLSRGHASLLEVYLRRVEIRLESQSSGGRGRAAKDARPMRRDALARHRIFSTSGIAQAEVTTKGVLRLDASMPARAAAPRACAKAWLENGG
ncbi:hypothetical protein [Brevundimonas naejangsanensis]|uniref:hypothetical protein n=1 Tax=Brevundimonas naejangsanensis TaxID=588932 RepID=UPI00106CEB46|nr:hypothetical protein [Brevundimonas naejangsanensis]QBQ47246.1 hypothetical protein E3U41_00220 [Brevundimonas naejangsanensis]